MAGYIRQDTANNISNGSVINADDLDGEFDAIVNAFNASTGHVHDGTSGNGAPILVVGPAQNVTISGTSMSPKTDNVTDLGTSSLEYKDLWIDGVANIDSLVADTADINAGTIDATAIGATTPAAGSFTTVNASGTITGNLTGNVTGALAGNATTATTLATARTITLSGDVAGSVSFNGSANVTITTTVQADSVALGTDTTGNYVAGISGTTNQVTVTSGTGEGVSPVVSLPATLVVPGTLTVTGAATITSGSITGITDLAVADGGTGASTLTGYVKGAGTTALTASATIPNTDITGLGTMSTQAASAVAITGGSITGITDLAVADGGTGASTLTGYVKGAGTTALTASATIPNTDITGLGTMATQNANAVAITGGTINGTTIGATTRAAVNATTLNANDASVISVSSASPALKVTQTGAGTAFLVEDAASTDTTPFIITADGFVGIGTQFPGSQLNIYHATSTTAQVTGDDFVTLNLSRAFSGFGSAIHSFRKYRGTIAAPLVVNSGDQVGSTVYAAYDGANLRGVAQIEGAVATFTAADDISGFLSFSTRPAGLAAALTERLRIAPAGQIGIGGANYGTSGQTIVSGGSAAAPAWGTLPVAGGGTGVTTSTGTGSNVLSDSPALAGTPTAPTAAALTNTTQLATTAFVLANSTGKTLLGTLTTTSGAIQTLSSLVLTSYKQLEFEFNNVSHNSGTTQTLSIGAGLALTGVTTSDSAWGSATVSLVSGVLSTILVRGNSLPRNIDSNTQLSQTGYSTATTSVSVSVSGGAFDAGTVTIYGVK